MFKKKKAVELINCYSFFWDKNEPTVRFNDVVDLIRKCDLTICNITYHAANDFTDNRCAITFALKGSLSSLRLFEFEIANSPKLNIFRQNKD